MSNLLHGGKSSNQILPQWKRVNRDNFGIFGEQNFEFLILQNFISCQTFWYIQYESYMISFLPHDLCLQCSTYEKQNDSMSSSFFENLISVYFKILVCRILIQLSAVLVSTAWKSCFPDGLERLITKQDLFLCSLTAAPCFRSIFSYSSLSLESR